MWQKYFKVVKIVPGRVVTPRFGTIDLSTPNIPLETLLALYESDFPYLEITPEGLQHFYGVAPVTSVEPEPEPVLNPDAEITEEASDESNETTEEPLPAKKKPMRKKHLK